MKEFSILMALFDLIPVVFFTVGAIILQRDFYYRMSRGVYALFAAGTIDIISAGCIKALYKVLYAVRVCDFDTLNTLFFPLQSLGFLLAGIAMIRMLTTKKQNTETLYSVAAVPVVFKGTMLFVGMMVVGLGCVNFGFAKVAAEHKKKGASVLFVVSFFFSLCMGYLSTKTFDKALINWIAQFVNTCGQGAFLWGALILHKAMKEQKQEV